MNGAGLLRRNARLRREYLYRKSLEGKERELYEKKRKIREALEGLCVEWILRLHVVVNQGKKYVNTDIDASFFLHRG